MKANIAFSRPMSVTLLLVGIAMLGTIVLLLAKADLDALVDERDAKGGFVTRSLPASRPSTGDSGATDQDLAVAAESATLAAAHVDALVRATVVEAGGIVLSSRSEVKQPDAAAGPDERIELQAVVQGTMDVLQASLYRLESGHPLILVEQLDLHPSEETDPVGRASIALPVLTATLTLSAYWDPPPP